MSVIKVATMKNTVVPHKKIQHPNMHKEFLKYSLHYMLKSSFQIRIHMITYAVKFIYQIEAAPRGVLEHGVSYITYTSYTINTEIAVLLETI